MAQSCNWTFTVNNYSDDDIANIAAWDCKYIVYGKEIGEEGTPHLQGFLIRHKNARLAAMKKLHATAHWEIAKADWETNYKYCTKDGDITEHGKQPLSKRKRGEDEKLRWENARTAAKEGRIDDIEADIYLRFYRTLKEIKKDHMVQPQEAEDVTGVWIYGPPGCGKSRGARTDYPGAYLKGQNRWWCGYQNEEYVIMDDFDCGKLGHLLKIWADRYPFNAETKGGMLAIRPKKLVITSNYSPDDPKFEWDAEETAAIKRRFKIIKMGTKTPFM